MSFVSENSKNKNFKYFLYSIYNIGSGDNRFLYQPDFEDYNSEIFPDEGIEVQLLYSNSELWAADEGLLGDIFIMLFYVPSLGEHFGARVTFDSWGGEIDADVKEVTEIMPNVFAPIGHPPTPVVIGL